MITAEIRGARFSLGVAENEGALKATVFEVRKNDTWAIDIARDSGDFRIRILLGYDDIELLAAKLICSSRFDFESAMDLLVEKHWKDVNDVK